MSDSVTPWTVAYQAPLSIGFSRQEYWGGLPFPSPGDLSDPGIEPGSPSLEGDALTSEPPGDSPIKTTGVGCHFLLQEIFLTQGSSPRLLIAGGFFTTEPLGKTHNKHIASKIKNAIRKVQFYKLKH